MQTSCHLTALSQTVVSLLFHLFRMCGFLWAFHLIKPQRPVSSCKFGSRLRPHLRRHSPERGSLLSFLWNAMGPLKSISWGSNLAPYWIFRMCWGVTVMFFFFFRKVHFKFVIAPTVRKSSCKISSARCSRKGGSWHLEDSNPRPVFSWVSFQPSSEGGRPSWRCNSTSCAFTCWAKELKRWLGLSEAPIIPAAGLSAHPLPQPPPPCSP